MMAIREGLFGGKKYKKPSRFKWLIVGLVIGLLLGLSIGAAGIEAVLTGDITSIIEGLNATSQS